LNILFRLVFWYLGKVVCGRGAVNKGDVSVKEKNGEAPCENGVTEETLMSKLYIGICDLGCKQRG